MAPKGNRYKSMYQGFLLAGVCVPVLLGCVPHAVVDEPQALCGQAVYDAIERRVGTQDGQGHGPDIGTLEWRSTVEFRLGLRDDPAVPALDSDQWCVFIQGFLTARTEVTAAGQSSAAGDAAHEGDGSMFCEGLTCSSALA